MSDESTSEIPEVEGLPRTLREFVDRAIEDTPALIAEQIALIRERVEYWFVYYDRTVFSWLLGLAFADTEEIRRLQQYYRETLEGFVTGWNNIEHVFYGVEMVMIGYLNEYVRLGREENARREREERERLYETFRADETPAPSLPDAPQSADESEGEAPPRRPNGPGRKAPAPAPAARPTDTGQFGLFG
ncbi:MAG: hypothetical protein LC800_20700 [Acidobacteria bacterium]|nr:hypothetical protein [Acidobacteriota bacterium]